MLFCPQCANILLVEKVPGEGDMRFYCETCPYIHKIDRKIEKRMELEKKAVDDVLGGEKAWENVDKTNQGEVTRACG